jgi:hypothetical protein
VGNVSLRDDFAKSVDLDDYRAELEAMGAEPEDVKAAVDDLRRRQED